jgi:ABC-type histidine transport system ATPase subunit
MVSEVPVIRVDKLCESFDRGVLRDISLDICNGSVVTVIDSSGSGKRTFLRCLNHLELPTSGEIYIDGEPMGFRIDATGKRRPETAASIGRMRTKLGMVFQHFNL